MWPSHACQTSYTFPLLAGSEELGPSSVFSIHSHGSSKRVAPRRNPQRASAQLLLSVYYWRESQLRWRLRHPTIPRRAHPRAEWSVSAPGRGTGQGKQLRCWEVQRQKVTVGAGRWVKRLRWRPRYTWSTSDSSATASDGYSSGLPHMTREVEQYHGVVSANGVYHKSINGTRHEQANAHRRAILDERIECCV